jgi:hypothetical protein
LTIDNDTLPVTYQIKVSVHSWYHLKVLYKIYGPFTLKIFILLPMVIMPKTRNNNIFLSETSCWCSHYVSRVSTDKTSQNPTIKFQNWIETLQISSPYGSFHNKKATPLGENSSAFYCTLNRPPTPFKGHIYLSNNPKPIISREI